ncbi:hypothetical protein [Saccharothrix syringae]|uniref:Secreted protein n=1 Tax=Saccharothrix syringae TaxID=103733 RepID=A0A5Q0GYE4_SACSY|nr:hypothetical protein [Saccharothrix syringae]QFZ19086.1 hypothetical protein EKG83_17980 [Saccharothrix syringae]
MTMRRVVAVLAAGAALSLPGTRTAEAAPPECTAGPWTAGPLHLEDPGLWSYTYTVTWCARGTEVVWVETKLEHQEFSATCAWQGVLKDSVEKVSGRQLWTAFSMGEFSCGGDGVETGAVNPWALINLHPDGNHDLDYGIKRQ